MGCRWLLLVLLSDVSLCPASDTAGDEGAADTAAAGLVAQSCTFKGKPVHPQRCSGLRHCDAWNGRYGPQSDLLDCARAEAQAVAAVDGLFAGVEGTQVHTACREALTALHCARVFGELQCEGGAELGLGTKPCSSACERISADCAEHTTAQSGSGALVCTAEAGYDTDPANCELLPRQDQLVLAAQHGLSPLAVDFIGLWESDEEKYDDTFLSATHRTSRSEMKGWSFYTNGPRWFDPTWFGLEGGTAIQRQYSQLQAADHVLRARITRRQKETGEEPDPVLLKQLEGDEKDAVAGAEPPLFGWMECATCVCVALAWRFQNQVAEQEAREAAEAEASLTPAANESDDDGSDGDDKGGDDDEEDGETPRPESEGS